MALRGGCCCVRPISTPITFRALIEDADIDAVVTDHPARWADAGTG